MLHAFDLFHLGEKALRPSASLEGTGLVKVVCKENKEQKEKRNGSCSLISTLYVWFPASWAPMVAERLFGWSSQPKGSLYPQSGQPASGPPRRTPERILGTNIAMTLLAPVGQWRILTALKWCIKSGNGH